MPPTNKRKQQLVKAREAKKLKQDDFGELNSSSLLDESGVYVSDEDEMYDPEIADESDMEAKIHQYAQEWVKSLNRDDTMSLSIFLHLFLSYRLHFSKGDSAKMISSFWDILIELLGSGRLILWRMTAHFLILRKEATKDLVSFGRMKNLIKKQGNLLKLMPV